MAGRSSPRTQAAAQHSQGAFWTRTGLQQLAAWERAQQKRMRMRLHHTPTCTTRMVGILPC